MSVLLQDVSVCVRERKKKRDRQTEVGVVLAVLLRQTLNS